MITRINDRMIGALHTVLGFSALICGLAVFMRAKGTRSHVWLGWAYVVSMIGLNVSAFGIYRLFGGFGVFHWFAVASLATIIGGLVPALLRRKTRHWVHYHYHFMCWSYVGLLGATSNEAFVHIPQLNEQATRFQWLPWASVGMIGLGGSIVIPLLANRTIGGIGVAVNPGSETSR